METMKDRIGKGFYDAFMKVFADIISQISTKLMTPFLAAFKTLEIQLEEWVGKLPNIFDPIIKVFYSFMDDMFRVLWNPVTEFAMKFIEVFSEGFAKVVDPFFKAIVSVTEYIVNWIKSLPPLIESIFLPLVGKITAETLLFVTGIFAAMFPLVMELGKIIIDMLEPFFEFAYEIANVIRDIFDIYSQEMEDMIKSGFDVLEAENKRAFNFMKNAYKSLQNIIADALRNGFEQGTREAGWAVFERDVREGLYEAIVDGIISSVTAFGIFMQTIGPYLDEITRLTIKAFLGVFDPDEWGKLIGGITNNVIASIQTLKPYFDAMYDPIKEMHDMFYYGDLPDEFYVHVQYEAPDMTWWEVLVLAIEKMLAPWTAIVDAISVVFISGTVGLLKWINKVVEVFIAVLEMLEMWLQNLWAVWTEIVVAIHNVWKVIWDTFFAPFIAGIIFIWQQVYNKIFRPIIKGIHTVFKWVWDTVFARIFATFHMVFQKVYNGFIDYVIAPLWELFGRKVVITFIEITGNLKNAWVDIANNIVKPNILKPLWNVWVKIYNAFIGWWLKPLVDTFRNIYNTFVMPFLNGLIDVFNFFLGKIWDLGSLLVPNWQAWFPERWEIEPLVEIPEDAFDIPSFITDEQAKKMFEDLFPDLEYVDIQALIDAVPTTEELVNSLKNLIPQFENFDEALAYYRGQIQSTAEFMEKYFPEMTDTYDDILNTVKGWVAPSNEIRQTMENLAPSLDALINPLEILSTKILDLIDAIEGRFPNAFPSYQTGGIIPSTGIYKLHAGEVYSPYTNGQFGIQNVSSPNITINLTAYVESGYDVKQIAEDIGFYVERRLER